MQDRTYVACVEFGAVGGFLREEIFFGLEGACVYFFGFWDCLVGSGGCCVVVC